MEALDAARWCITELEGVFKETPAKKATTEEPQEDGAEEPQNGKAQEPQEGNAEEPAKKGEVEEPQKCKTPKRVSFALVGDEAEDVSAP